MSALFAILLASMTPCKDASFWTSEAILPLVVVRNGKVEADIGQCSQEVGLHPDGQRWRSVNRWGKKVGMVANIESGFETVSGTRGVGVFVRGATPTFKSFEWVPDVATRKSLVEAVGWRAAKEARDVAFFQSQSGRQWSVVAGKSSIALIGLTDGKWKRLYRASSATPEATWQLYKLAAVVDMNDDGTPEVVYHFSEYEDGRGHEVVLGATGKKGRWREIATNEDTGP